MMSEIILVEKSFKCKIMIKIKTNYIISGSMLFENLKGLALVNKKVWYKKAEMRIKEVSRVWDFGPEI